MASDKHISDLPCELLTKIFSYVEEYKNFALTCKKFNDISRNNRVINLDTSRCIHTSEEQDVEVEYVIPIDGKLIIITKYFIIKQQILVVGDNRILYSSEIFDKLYCINILNHATKTTVTILGSYKYSSISDKTYKSKYLDKFNDIIKYIFSYFFKRYNYNFIIITCNFNQNPKNSIIEIYKDNTKYQITGLSLHYIPIYIDGKYIYLSDMLDDDIYLYNYNIRTVKKLPIKKHLTDEYYDNIPKDVICKYYGIGKIKVFINILDSLNLPNVIFDKLTSILVKGDLHLRELITTQKYLAVSYSDISNKKDCIIVFNLYSRKYFIISAKIKKEYLKKGKDIEVYDIYKIYTRLYLLGIYSNTLYVYRYNYKTNIRSLYSIGLR